MCKNLLGILYIICLYASFACVTTLAQVCLYRMLVMRDLCILCRQSVVNDKTYNNFTEQSAYIHNATVT